jgi:hypothetical protein
MLLSVAAPARSSEVPVRRAQDGRVARRGSPPHSPKAETHRDMESEPDRRAGTDSKSGGVRDGLGVGTSALRSTFVSVRVGSRVSWSDPPGTRSGRGRSSLQRAGRALRSTWLSARTDTKKTMLPSSSGQDARLSISKPEFDSPWECCAVGESGRPRWAHNPETAGSNPARATILLNALVAELADAPDLGSGPPG